MKTLKTAAKFAAKSTKSEKAAETKAEDRIAERIAEKVAKWEVFIGHAVQGIEFLVNKAVEVGKDIRHFQQAVIEKNPEFAKHYLDVGERVATLQIAAGEKANDIVKEMYLGTVQAVFGTLNQVVAKTDITELAKLSIANDAHQSAMDEKKLELQKLETMARIDRERIQAEAQVEETRIRAEYYASQKKSEELRQAQLKADMAERAEERAARKAERKPAQA